MYDFIAPIAFEPSAKCVLFPLAPDLYQSFFCIDIVNIQLCDLADPQTA
jgi:hypothetical protein